MKKCIGACLSCMRTQQHGFSGITHVLIGIMLFLLVLILPIPFLEGYAKVATQNTMMLALIFLTVVGGSLMPDLDNMKSRGGSTMGWSLGILGSLISTMMVAISGVVYGLLATGADRARPPESQHRMLWHTPIIWVILGVLMFISVPNTDTTLLAQIQAGKLVSVSMPMLVVLLSAICVYCGTNILVYRALKLVGRQRWCSMLSALALIWCLVVLIAGPMGNLKIFAVSVAMGAIFHIVGDMLTKGSSPVLFPIPTRHGGKWYLWWKPSVLGPFAVETGGVVNTILNAVFLVVDVVLLLIWMGWWML